MTKLWKALARIPLTFIYFSPLTFFKTPIYSFEARGLKFTGIGCGKEMYLKGFGIWELSDFILKKVQLGWEIRLRKTCCDHQNVSMYKSCGPPEVGIDMEGCWNGEHTTRCLKHLEQLQRAPGHEQSL